MRVIEPKYEIGETVYLKTDVEQTARQVYAYTVFRTEIIYKLAMGTTVSEHYDFEISKEKDFSIVIMK